ncbi:hypothetical protein DPEC_G00188400 [Dallia pectoralis]|uniref:Uncharacterized protein n=1 Tax=Dallia pectoralis TaxID=75939 RepID=A0ACC2GC95_DALPE|nr:hypothetical protein DPEC_G00188400 [Dallia pectoralis]
MQIHINQQSLWCTLLENSTCQHQGHGQVRYALGPEDRVTAEVAEDAAKEHKLKARLALIIFFTGQISVTNTAGTVYLPPEAAFGSESVECAKDCGGFRKCISSVKAAVVSGVSG